MRLLRLYLCWAQIKPWANENLPYSYFTLVDNFF
jgi:hypothetical protein